VRDLHARFDRDLDEARLDALLDRGRGAESGGEPGSHEYRFEDLGLDAAAERAHFARYQVTFTIPSEE